MMPASKEELDRKYTLIEQMITEDRNKTLAKVA